MVNNGESKFVSVGQCHKPPIDHPYNLWFIPTIKFVKSGVVFYCLTNFTIKKLQMQPIISVCQILLRLKLQFLHVASDFGDVILPQKNSTMNYWHACSSLQPLFPYTFCIYMHLLLTFIYTDISLSKCLSFDFFLVGFVCTRGLDFIPKNRANKPKNTSFFLARNPAE